MKVLLLDLGGVVIGVDPRGCFRHWGAAAGLDAAVIASRWRADDAYEAFEVGAIDFNEYIESLSQRLGIALAEDDWRRGWNALLQEPFESVVNALPAIAARIPLYCFSNTNVVHQTVWEQRHAQALAPFRKIYTSWQLGCRKPTVEAYRRVAADIGVAPGDILFLDDNQDNVVGAQAAGMRARRVADPAQTLSFLRGIERGR